MKQNIYYIKFALQFADKQITELADSYNRQVCNRGWSSMRAYHDHALIDEFQNRGINISVVYDGHRISFNQPVSYDLLENKLVALI